MPWILSRPSGVADPIQVGAFGAPGTLTFGSTISVDAADTSSFVVPATTSATFTIGAPTALLAGARLLFTIRNTSGGALSATSPFTNAIFKLATWTQPANGFSRSIEFSYDGVHLVEVARTASDIPN